MIPGQDEHAVLQHNRPAFRDHRGPRHRPIFAVDLLCFFLDVLHLGHHREQPLVKIAAPLGATNDDLRGRVFRRCAARDSDALRDLTAGRHRLFAFCSYRISKIESTRSRLNQFQLLPAGELLEDRIHDLPVTSAGRNLRFGPGELRHGRPVEHAAGDLRFLLMTFHRYSSSEHSAIM